MTTTTVPSGQNYAGTILPGDVVGLDGYATSTDVLDYGTEYVGQEYIGPGAVATGTIVEDGGLLSVYDAVVNTTVDAGGNLVLQGPGATSMNTSVYGTEILSRYLIGGPSVAGTSSKDTVYAGGVLNGMMGTVSDVTIAGGKVDATQLTGETTFSGPGGVLDIESSTPVSASILGFAAGDEIQIGNENDLTPTVTISGDDVDVSFDNGSYNYSFDIAGSSQENLSVVSGDQDVTIEIVCFLAGTAIATPDGDRAIETLTSGDLVLTADGAARPVRWLGRQTVVTRFADPARVAPILIRAGALGDGLPARDLHVSPDHALMVDGVFVQAGALVNGVSITREDAGLPERFTYYHLELADHALILAEGVPAETFIDNVDRMAFDNWHEHVADGAPLAEMPHPRAKSHRQVPQALRARLLARVTGRLCTAA